MRQKWAVFLCQCGTSVPLDAALVTDPTAFVLHAAGPEDLPRFAAQARAQAAQRVLVCCVEADAAAAALREDGLTATVHTLDLEGRCFAVHADAATAASKARRLITAAMRAGEEAVETRINRLEVGPRVLIAGEAAGALALAERLGESAQPVVFVEDGETLAPAQAAQVNPGRVTGVEGRLGAFTVTVQPPQPGAPSRRVSAPQVAFVGPGGAPTLPGRTGLHRLPVADEETLRAAAGRMADLIGTFEKSEAVTYDPALCAGGAAGREACGLCLRHCPYDALARDPEQPLRIRVDHLSCEGCGACASACPTSALAFTEPSAGALYAQMHALVAERAADERPVLVLHCGENGARLLDRAGRERLGYPANLLPVAVPCLRFVSEAHLLAAVRLGAAGVALLGCEACPNGERALLLEKLKLTGDVLGAFKLGAERIRLITTQPGGESEALAALTSFADAVGPPPLSFTGKRFHARENRAAVAEALAGFMAAGGLHPGGIPVAADAAYALADVRAEGCTLCRSCVNVCPTHAFVFDEGAQALQFKHIACVGCGLCEQACPERVITLRRELYLEPDALEHQTVAQDEAVFCPRCAKPFGNRRALDAVLARLAQAPGMADAFAGARAHLLTYCPDCRAVSAILEVNKGWVP